MKTEIIEIVKNVLSFLNPFKNLKMALNDDIVVIFIHSKTYVYYRRSGTLNESEIPFEMIYNQYFY